MTQQTSLIAPLQGRTFSLHGDSQNSDGYYTTIADLADAFLKEVPDRRLLLTKIQTLSKSRRRLKKLVSDGGDGSLDGFLVNTLGSKLSPYTRGVQAHLRGLSGFARLDRTLTTSEEQYHLYMLEIELVNRLFADGFKASEKKLAFLPHCLRDMTADCRAAQRDLDYVCKGCTDDCKVNRVTKLLRRHGVTPYIWMTANLHSLFRNLKREGKSLGVLGIACIPELARGMRLCLRFEVPVVALPLDANRCARWWGEFHWNTVNFQKLERLLAG
jgi:hypothetical protein